MRCPTCGHERETELRAIPEGGLADGETINISVDLASGRYEGLAKMVDSRKLIAQFPWKGNKQHRCWITKGDLR